MIYAVNYDLKRPGQDYARLYEAIKGCGDWWHYLGSTWLVDTLLDADGIWHRLAPHIDKNDNVLIIGVTKNYSGWLPQDAWDWISKRRSLAARGLGLPLPGCGWERSESDRRLQQRRWGQPATALPAPAPHPASQRYSNRRVSCW